MPSEDRSTSELFVRCLFILIVWILSIFLKGIVISQLWSWFIVPLGVKSITVAWAIGLSAFISLFTANPSTKEYNTENGNTDLSQVIGKMIGYALGGPMFVLFFGWLIHSFFMPA